MLLSPAAAALSFRFEYACQREASGAGTIVGIAVGGGIGGGIGTMPVLGPPVTGGDTTLKLAGSSASSSMS